jgi:hypothetical protein
MDWIMLTVAIMVLLMLLISFAMRYFIHLERMALLKQGIVPPALVNPILKRGSFGLLLAGLITTLSGVGLSIGLYLGLGTGFWLIGGFIPIGVGLALILGYMLSGGQVSSGEPDQQREEGNSDIVETNPDKI